MDQKALKKNPCPDCTFCQFCCESRCNLCRSPHRKKEEKDKKPKIHKPLFLKY